MSHVKNTYLRKADSLNAVRIEEQESDTLLSQKEHECETLKSGHFCGNFCIRESVRAQHV